MGVHCDSTPAIQTSTRHKIELGGKYCTRFSKSLGFPRKKSG
jgi:hypothetical protein